MTDKATMTRWQKLKRGLSVFAVSIAMVALGLVVTGKTGEALRTYKRLKGSKLGLEPMEGSNFDPVKVIQTPSGPELAQYCSTRRSLDSILAHYEKQASKEALRFTKTLAPYIKVDNPDLALLCWINDKGHRCGVVAFPMVRGQWSRYVLFKGGRAPNTANADPMVSPRLPLGFELPNGSTPLYDLRQDDQAWTYYTVPGHPNQIVSDLHKRLRTAGCQVDSKKYQALTEVNDRKQLTIPFRKDGYSGFLTVSNGLEPGSSHVSYIVHR